MKNILVLGSTGSIGVNVLRVIETHPDQYRAIGLAAGSNVGLLLQQIERFRPKRVALRDKDSAEALARQLSGNHRPEIYVGPEGFIRLAVWDEVKTVVSAMSGSAGLVPTYAAIEAGKQVALANKETIVMAGSLVMETARRKGTTILPIDSEHNAIFQSLLGHPRADLKRVIITASGGPFRDMTLEEMASVTPEAALKHPTWKMGPKITIDSATLMNKGLEAIEAKWLFDLRVDQISILIHPQSVVHSMVEYKDGSIMAQMGIPNMFTPISYSLSFPRHLATPLPPLKLEEIGAMTFSKPDPSRFRCLDLAFRAAEIGGTMPAVLSGADEIAVELFLDRRLTFLQIPLLIEKVMEAHVPGSDRSIETILEAGEWARVTALAFSKGLPSR